MVWDGHANLVDTFVATAPSPATSGTSLVVTTGQGGTCPTVPFNATIGPAATVLTRANSEIVRVTARSTDSLTIARAQEGTTARAITAGDRFLVGPTAKTITDLETAIDSVGSAMVVAPAARTVRPIPGDTGLQTIADSGAITGTYLVADYADAATCHRTAIQAAMTEAGVASPPAASGSTPVDRGGVCLLPYTYQIKEAPSQLYGLLVPYGCSTLFCPEPAVQDRSTPTDELVSGAILQWVGGSGTVGTGTADIPQSTTTKRLLQVGQAASGARRAANPHGFKIQQVAFIATATPTAFEFVQVIDCNDVETHDCAFSGNSGVGNWFVRHYGTLAPDDGSVANRHFRIFGRNGYGGILVPPDSTGATDGAIVDSRILAHKFHAVHLDSGGWGIGGPNSHFTTSSTTGSPNHIYLNSGGPFTISEIYFDTLKADTAAAHIRLSAALTRIQNCHFKPAGTVMTRCIDASGTTGWKAQISDCDVLASAALTSFVEVNNSATNTSNTITTTALANAGATSVSVAALGGALASGDWVSFWNATTAKTVLAKLTANAAASATSISVAALPAAVPSGSTGTMTPVLVRGIRVQNAATLSAGFATVKTTGGTVLDHLAHHLVDPWTPSQ